jgi:hypothetical protein
MADGGKQWEELDWAAIFHRGAGKQPQGPQAGMARQAQKSLGAPSPQGLGEMGLIHDQHRSGPGQGAMLLEATHAGMTVDDFNDRVRRWLDVARHPVWKRPYSDLAYQPMLEVLDLLRDHGFTPYIVSGGGADFMRVWAEEVYGIPPSLVIGSYGKVRYELRDDRPVLVKEGGIELIDDREGKPVGIHRFIGRRPVACFGNSDGDQAMLEWTTIGHDSAFGLIVHHTDGEREYAYDAAPPSSGRLVEALREAPGRGWLVVDMARDWKVLFPAPRAARP